MRLFMNNAFTLKSLKEETVLVIMQMSYMERLPSDMVNTGNIKMYLIWIMIKNFFSLKRPNF